MAVTVETLDKLERRITLTLSAEGFAALRARLEASLAERDGAIPD